MNGFGEHQKPKKKINNSNFSKEQLINQAYRFHAEGKNSKAIKCYQYLINQGFADHKLFFNYGFLLNGLGKLQEAESLYRKAIELNPDFAEAHYNLGIILMNLGNLKEAELSTRKVIEINPNYTNAYANLGIILMDLGNLKEAELSTRKAIELNPDFAEAHSNLGIILRDLGNLKEAELSTRKAIELNPDFADAHSNLGIILRDLGNLKEAEFALLKSIKLEPKSLSYFNYASCLFKREELDAAKKSIYDAISLRNKNIEDNLLYAAKSAVDFAIGKSVNQTLIDYSKDSKIDNQRFDRLILNRTVEDDLLPYLYSLKNKKLQITKDARYGEGVCSKDFQLFEDNSSIIQNLAKDIKDITKKELDKKEIIFNDSFFNIFISGSGAKPHNHIQQQDSKFNLNKHKYSLVYYLDIGDQTGEDPGILKLYEPEEEILPTNGMILIIEGDKYHSVSYKGKKDRVMIGVNFYGF